MLPPELRTTTVQHDPVPDHKLKIIPFTNKEKIVWHLLRHGFIDYWINPESPHILFDLSCEDRNKVWKSFISDIKCPRWAIDFPNKEKEITNREWNDALERNTQIPGIAKKKSGCTGCQENNKQQFNSCYRFFEKYRLIFLKKLKFWINATIQDNDCLSFYEQGNITKNNPKRLHAHIDKRTGGDLWAYVVCQYEDTGQFVIFKMIFQRSTKGLINFNDLICYSKGKSTEYFLKTIYGLHSKDGQFNTWRETITFIKKDVLTRQVNFSNVEISKCTKINWR